MDNTKGQAGVVVLMVLALLIILGGWFYFSKDSDENSATIPGWKTYTLNNLTFEYPNDWTTKEDKYPIPAQAGGQPQEARVLTLYKNSTSPTSTEVIVFDGRRFDCAGFGVGGYCSAFYNFAFEARSTSTEVTDIYNRILRTITHKKDKDYFKISSPTHLEVWKGGESRTIKWDPGAMNASTSVMIYLRNASSSRSNLRFAGMSNTGEYQISLPEKGSSTMYYAEVVTFRGFGTTTEIFNGWSDPFYIQFPNSAE